MVVLLDDEVDFSKDTLGLDFGAEIVVEAEDLLAIGRTLTLLARVVEGQPLLVVDGREQLNRLVASASSLRKLDWQIHLLLSADKTIHSQPWSESNRCICLICEESSTRLSKLMCI